MLRALYSAAAGMQSQQMNLDVISNNLANANTTGFKASQAAVSGFALREHEGSRIAGGRGQYVADEPANRPRLRAGGHRAGPSPKAT